MAERGEDTLRFGPMKPVGLNNPHDDFSQPYAVVQLRPDNSQRTLYNIVGFQTKMIYSEQVRIFRTIPGLEKANFARLGGIHRNTFINSPKILQKDLSLKEKPTVFFGGQITGVEGYVESTAIGLLAALFIFKKLRGASEIQPPTTTAVGALHNYITTVKESTSFQPMNINFGLFPEKCGVNKVRDKDSKRLAYTNQAKQDWENWLKANELELSIKDDK